MSRNFAITPFPLADKDRDNRFFLQLYRLDYWNKGRVAIVPADIDKPFLHALPCNAGYAAPVVHPDQDGSSIRIREGQNLFRQMFGFYRFL